MMRYQRVSPDFVPSSSTVKKPAGVSVHHPIHNPIASSSSSSPFEPAKGFGFRSPSRAHFVVDGDNALPQNELTPTDMLLQWGHRKKPRASRTEIRSLADDSSSSSSAQQQRRSLGPSAASSSMPPPPPPSATVTNGRARKDGSGSGSLLNRNLEDNSRGVVSRSAPGKRSPPREKSCERKSSGAARPTVHDKPNNGSSAATQAVRSNHVDSAPLHHHHHDQEAQKESFAEALEWPKIQIPLSRKEKEEDFFVMKGSKLPQRPKKRPKNVERALQYIFPGMWLPDVNSSRYEVREKKCAKKQKRRGLKGMESLESDSE